MRSIWNKIIIGVLVVFGVWMFYNLGIYSKRKTVKDHNSGHRHDRHHGEDKLEDKHKTQIQQDSLGLMADSSEQVKTIRLKLTNAEEKIKKLKLALSKGKGFNGQKLVHLDLKGAPPKMPYLIKLLSLLKTWGATGLLVEYEDMFPYSGDLEILKRKHAYSVNEINQFLDECEKQNLNVVPLIQSFGHLEFVLKHKKFEYLRETKSSPTSICPSNNDSVPLIKTIIDQVLQLHPKIKYFHVGGDEVFNLKTCSICSADKRSKIRLFKDHMIPILKHLKEKNLIPIMWDDMMRRAVVADIKELGSLVEPMVWGYGVIKQNLYPQGMWDRFAAVFPKLWVASGFKGATKPDSDYVPIKFHLQNNLDWLDVIKSLPKTTKVVGVAITGWSRVSHLHPLMELLPSGLPSLAFCLKALDYGEMNKDLEQEVVESLGLPQNFSLEITPFKKEYKDVTATFPGHKIFTLVGKLTAELKGAKPPAVEHLTSLKEEFLEPLKEIYDMKTVDDWINEKITAKISSAQKKG